MSTLTRRCVGPPWFQRFVVFFDVVGNSGSEPFMGRSEYGVRQPVSFSI